MPTNPASSDRSEYLNAYKSALRYSEGLTLKEFTAEVRALAKREGLYDDRPGPDGEVPSITPTPGVWIALALTVVEDMREGYCDGMADLRNDCYR